MEDPVNLDQIKKTIRALLISAKNGLGPQQLLRDYVNVVGTPIPLEKLGFKTLADAVNGMPDVVRVEKTFSGRVIYRAVPDTSSMHIAGLVSKQRSSKPYNAIRSTPNPSSSSTKVAACKRSEHVPVSFGIKMRQLMLSYQEGLPLMEFQEAFHSRFGYYINATSWGFANITEALQSMKDIVRIIYDDTDGPRKCYIMPAKKERTSDSLKSVERSSSDIGNVNENADNLVMKGDLSKNSSVELQKKLTKLLASFPAGLSLSKIPYEYKKMYQENLSLESTGCTTLLQLVTCLQSESLGLRQTSMEKGDWTVFNKSVNQSANDKMVPDGVAKFLKQLIKRQSMPVFVETLPLLYKSVTNKDIPFMSLGYISLVDMLKHTPGLEVKDTASSGRLILFEEDVTTPTDLSPVSDDELDKENKNNINQPCSTSVYIRLRLSKFSKSLGVYVTFVKSPSCICVQIIRDDTTLALDSLHEDMAMYYNSKAGEKSTISQPVIGQPCCTRYNCDGYWYRGEIVGFPSPTTAEVLYVDYGNKSVVSKVSIRQPKAHYLSLPAQGIWCRLANIKPPGAAWSKRAARILFEMTKDKPVAAFVTNVKDECVSVCLCDTTTDRDIHINDVLVAQGLAVFAPDTDQDEQHCDAFQLDPEPSECSAQDINNIRMPSTTTSTTTILSTTSQPSLSVLHGGTIGQVLPTSAADSAFAQLFASMLLNQTLHQNSNSSNSVNPFLPSPISPIPYQHLLTTIPPFQAPCNRNIPPPPGFEQQSPQPPPVNGISCSHCPPIDQPQPHTFIDSCSSVSSNYLSNAHYPLPSLTDPPVVPDPLLSLTDLPVDPDPSPLLPVQPVVPDPLTDSPVVADSSPSLSDPPVAPYPSLSLSGSPVVDSPPLLPVQPVVSVPSPSLADPPVVPDPSPLLPVQPVVPDPSLSLSGSPVVEGPPSLQVQPVVSDPSLSLTDSPVIPDPSLSLSGSPVVDSPPLLPVQPVVSDPSPSLADPPVVPDPSPLLPVQPVVPDPSLSLSGSPVVEGPPLLPVQPVVSDPSPSLADPPVVPDPSPLLPVQPVVPDPSLSLSDSPVVEGPPSLQVQPVVSDPSPSLTDSPVIPNPSLSLSGSSVVDGPPLLSVQPIVSDPLLSLTDPPVVPDSQVISDSPIISVPSLSLVNSSVVRDHSLSLLNPEVLPESLPSDHPSILPDSSPLLPNPSLSLQKPSLSDSSVLSDPTPPIEDTSSILPDPLSILPDPSSILPDPPSILLNADSTIKPPSFLMSIKEVEVPKPYFLHILRCSNHPYILGKEISSWMWEADMLNYHLRKIKRVIPVKEITRGEAPDLFESLLHHTWHPLLWEVVGLHSMHTYSLENTIKVIELFNGPRSVKKAIENALVEWTVDNEKFWMNEKTVLEQKLLQLQDNRTALLNSMAHSSSVSKSSLGSTDVFKQFMKIDEEIESVKSKMELISKSESAKKLSIAFEERSERSILKSQSEKSVGIVGEKSSVLDKKKGNVKEVGNDKLCTPPHVSISHHDGLLMPSTVPSLPNQPTFHSSGTPRHDNSMPLPPAGSRQRRPQLVPTPMSMYPPPPPSSLLMPPQGPHYPSAGPPTLFTSPYLYNTPSSSKRGLNRWGRHTVGAAYSPSNLVADYRFQNLI